MTSRSREAGPGPTGKRTAQAVSDLREPDDEDRRLSKSALGRKLQEVGRPMTPDVITKMEAGQRRIDVDDLIALAIVFEVSPNRLLLPDPRKLNFNEAVALTEKVAVTSRQAWRWTLGQMPLPGQTEPWRVQKFRSDSRPHSGVSSHIEEMALQGKFEPVISAASALLTDNPEMTMEDIVAQLTEWQLYREANESNGGENGG